MPHPSLDVPGTLRRAPAPSFAHAICLDQGVYLDTGHNHPLRWQISDAYGLMDNTLTHDDAVTTWPVVYIPATTDQWAEQTSHLAYAAAEQENPR